MTSSTNISTSSSKQPTESAMISRIKQFYGHQDGHEDAEEYLEDIDYAVDRSKTSDEQDLDRERRILFRQNLLDKAERWYSKLPRSTRTDWPKLKEVFLAHYRGDTEDEPTGLPMASQRISTLTQLPDETITKYLDRWDVLETQGGAAPTGDLGLYMVEGLSDDNQRARILDDMEQEGNYSYRRARELIGLAYMSSLWADECQEGI